MLEKLFPIYSEIKKHKNPGSTVIYVNLVWLWIILSLLVSAYFSYQHVSAKMAEYEHMKKNYAHYNKHLIELSIPEYIQPVVNRARENQQDILDIYKYYHIKINYSQSQKNDFFNKLLLKKATDSDNWFVKISTNQLGVLDAYLLYNTDWLIAHRINLDQLLKEKVGNYELYFTSYPVFIDQRMYGSVTWRPVWLIYPLNTFAVLWICAQVLMISGLCLIVFFHASKKLMRHDNGHKYSVVGLVLKHNRNYEDRGACIILKGIENVTLFPAQPNKPTTGASSEKT